MKQSSLERSKKVTTFLTYLALIVGAIIGTFALLFLVAFFTAKRKKVLENRERNMPDSEIIRRLLAYAKPYRKHFVLVFFVMLLANVYSVVSPLIIGHIEETVVGNFEMSYLLSIVGGYVAVLLVSLVCTYIQAMVLQKVSAEEAFGGDNTYSEGGK